MTEAARDLRFIAGDPIRGWGALCVVIFHAAVGSVAKTSGFGQGDTLSTKFGEPWGSILKTLPISLDLFFMLSAFLLARSFMARFVAGRPLPNVRRYFMNRVLRIVPAFWLVLTLFLLLPGPDFGRHLTGVAGIGSTYFFSQVYHPTGFATNLYQAWTIDVEVGFYLALPVFAWLLTRLIGRRGTPWSRAWAVVGAMAVAFAASVWLKSRATPPPSGGLHLFSDLSFAAHAWAFAPGVAIAALEPLVAPKLSGTQLGRRLAWLFVLVGAAFLYVAGAVIEDVAGQPHGVGSTLVEATAATALGLAPLVLQWTTGGCWRILDNRLLHWLGQRSYGTYLIHVAIALEISKALPATWSPQHYFFVLAPLMIILGWSFAEISWRLVEHPALERRLPWRDRVVPAQA